MKSASITDQNHLTQDEGIAFHPPLESVECLAWQLPLNVLPMYVVLEESQNKELGFEQEVVELNHTGVVKIITLT